MRAENECKWEWRLDVFKHSSAIIFLLQWGVFHFNGYVNWFLWNWEILQSCNGRRENQFLRNCINPIKTTSKFLGYDCIIENEEEVEVENASASAYALQVYIICALYAVCLCCMPTWRTSHTTSSVSEL